MSNQQNTLDLSIYSTSERLFLGLFPVNQPLLSYLIDLLKGDRYQVKLIESTENLQTFITQHKEQIDCLIFIKDSSFEPVLEKLARQGILLPIVIIDSTTQPNQDDWEFDSWSKQLNFSTTKIYHNAEIYLEKNQSEKIVKAINLAITKFLNLAPSCILDNSSSEIKLNYQENSNSPSFLLLQQRRLSEKLKERLGYLGVYYKRNSKDFYRNLSERKKQELIQQLSKEYRQIILAYFERDSAINQLIDQFVNQAFFADLSVSQILEIHMELMDEFAQQLKIEGRNEDILLDYRLTLIDIIAHLCEMYRRSIPREDLPIDLLFKVD